MGKTGILCSKQGIGLPFFGIRRFFVMQLHGASPSAIFAGGLAPCFCVGKVGRR